MCVNDCPKEPSVGSWRDLGPISWQVYEIKFDLKRFEKW